MNDKLAFILARLDSRHLAELWCFYRDHFPNDISCIDFLAAAVHNEPELSDHNGIESADDSGAQEDIYIPRRMMNAVMRLVSAARDMEQIRSGKDVFKIIYIVSCTETLKKLSGSKNETKGKMIRDFFEESLSEDDKRTIISKIKLISSEDAVINTELSIEDFAQMLYNLRNCAAHEGDYWDACFNNNNSDYTLLFSDKKNNYETQMSYREFEDIFVRACIVFISKYVNAHTNTTTE